MATSVIPTRNAALTMYRGYYPNGVSVMDVSPGFYRTDGSHLPSEGVVGNTYGTLLILSTDESGYKFVMYVGLQGQSGVFSTLNHNWHQTSSA